MSETEWRNMASAPKDGTVIEIRCTYGVAPWYALYRWTEDEYERASWRDASDPRKGVADLSTVTWRPTQQQPESYVDPTGGDHDSPEYWLRAAGRTP